ncbi:MAG: helix-turn-helix transcriptional regulator [Mollicutes bacterium]|nr:helix-turn-helix transcriptional regulator [Mollicutes bacterium]
MFNERLREYRLGLGIKTKQEMASKLGMKVDLYTKLENGVRKPSKQALKKIIDFSGISEVYWLYGIDEKNNEHFNKGDSLSSTKECLESLIKIGLIKDDKLSEEVKTVLLAALKTDIKYILENEKK